MWFKIVNTIINQDNIIKIIAETRANDIKLFVCLPDNEKILVGTFNTSNAAHKCIDMIQDHIKRGSDIVDLTPLVNISNMSYDK